MNYVAYHVHSDLSLRDSCTKFEDYVKRAAELGQTAIGSTEHGKPLEWVSKKVACDQAGIKFLFGVEAYLSELPVTAYRQQPPAERVRDNYHTVLIARNYEGIKEINRAIFKSTDDEHFYYDNRITFDEFLALSSNVITTSACLASPLNRLDDKNPYYEKLIQRYDFLEIQPHNHPDQIRFNQQLLFLSDKYSKPLIAGTDTHNLDAYKAECRRILLLAKKIKYSDEDAFNLNYRTYDELVDEFRMQDALPESKWMEAIANTNMLADMVEDFELDTSLKYPILYGDKENDKRHFFENIDRQFQDKLSRGIIPKEQAEQFQKNLVEEKAIFSDVGMCGFMQLMSEILMWCREQGIDIGPGRGSVGGSSAAYVTEVTDINPVQWGTIFSRFVSRDRGNAVGDIDVDVPTERRPEIFQYLINRFGVDYTARVPSYGTLADKAIIDDVGRALATKWQGTPEDNPYSLANVAKIKKEFESKPDETKKKYAELFYYYDGLAGTRISQSVHPAGIVVSPITLTDNYGTFWKDNEIVIEHDMDWIHHCSLVKFDFLGLRNVKIISDACKLIGIPYPRTYMVDWNDPEVFKDMLRSPIGLFQFEGDYAFRALRQMKPKRVEDITLVTAAIRPSGATYRDDLLSRKPHKNPSAEIDALLERNNGYLVYQEDVTRFLTDICGYDGGAADTVRRGIAEKNLEMLEREMPKILEGYCAHSTQPRDVAEKEAKEFMDVIRSSASYAFNYSHAASYSCITYILAMLRCKYPLEFLAAFLNNAANDDDIANGQELARIYGITIKPPRFGFSRCNYIVDYETHSISKGIESVKGLNATVPEELYELSHSHTYTHFSDIILDAKAKTSLRKDQLYALVDIDFFAEYGNIPTLRNICDAIEYFKWGDAKSIKKDKAGLWTQFITPHANGLTKAGKEAASWTLEDVPAILRDFEDYQRGLNIPDLTLSEKATVQKEHLGYVDLTTGRDKDRRSVIAVSKPFPLLSKKTGKPWCYKVDLQSLGTGKVVNCSIRPGIFTAWPFKEGDTLRVKAHGMTMDKNGYWWCENYVYLISLDDIKEGYE